VSELTHELIALMAKPMPVDHWMDHGRGLVPARPKGMMQAHVAVSEKKHGALEITSYVRSPWATPIVNPNRIQMRSAWPTFSASPNIAALDTGNVSRTFTPCTVSNGNPTNMSLGGGNDQVSVGWGTDATASTGNEYQLLGLNDATLAPVSYDDVNLTCRPVGSKVSVLGTVIREVGLYRVFLDSGGVKRTLLMDRAVVTPVVVPPLGVITVAYICT